jgi:hypothetical protein
MGVWECWGVGKSTFSKVVHLTSLLPHSLTPLPSTEERKQLGRSAQMDLLSQKPVDLRRLVGDRLGILISSTEFEVQLCSQTAKSFEF